MFKVRIRCSLPSYLFFLLFFCKAFVIKITAFFLFEKKAFRKHNLGVVKEIISPLEHVGAAMLSCVLVEELSGHMLFVSLWKVFAFMSPDSELPAKFSKLLCLLSML